MIGRLRHWAAGVGAALVELGRAIVRRPTSTSTSTSPPPPLPTSTPAARMFHMVEPAREPFDRAGEIGYALVEQLEHRRAELAPVLWAMAALQRPRSRGEAS